MSYTVKQENFDSLAACWANPSHSLQWNSPFVLPAWLKTWWQELGAGTELYLGAVRQEEEVIGIAPLLVSEGKASLVGSVDVCDYLDFVVAPGREVDFFSTLLDDLKEKGISRLELRPLRPDSTVLTHLVSVARSRGDEVVCHPEDVSSELDLPPTWEEYLAALTKKQRHEVRRKLRRLGEAGEVKHRCLQVSRGEAGDYADTFLKLFALSRAEKASFMTAEMESFFRSMVENMAEIGLLSLGILELDALPVAMIVGFDYNGSYYLYNSAYDPRYNSLSVGLLCKILCIKESIEQGKKTWDFLKGDENYKYQLGGKEVPLYNCQITIN